jgi:hypothetical protein
MLLLDRDGKWVIVVDNLNTHSSEALVRLIARLESARMNHESVLRLR